MNKLGIMDMAHRGNSNGLFVLIIVIGESQLPDSTVEYNTEICNGQSHTMSISWHLAEWRRGQSLLAHGRAGLKCGSKICVFTLSLNELTDGEMRILRGM